MVVALLVVGADAVVCEDAAAVVGLLATGVEVAGLETVLAGAEAEVDCCCFKAFCCCAAAAGLAMADWAVEPEAL